MDNDASALRARGLTARLGFGRSPALLVIDLMVGFTDAARPFGAPLDDEVQQTARLLAAARRQRIPVLFTAAVYDTPDLADAGLWAIKVPASDRLRAGGEDVAIDARLERRDTEAVVVKKYASAFFGTDLATRLTTLGVDTVVLAGCSTSGCVRATAVDALQHGFRPMVVREAVGDRNRAAHDQALFDLDAKYADVVGADEALRAMTAAARPEPAHA